MMRRQARRSGLVMGFDTHMIAGSRACPHQLGSLTRPSPARQARTLPRPWVGDAAGVAGALGAEQLAAHGGVDAVGAHQQAGLHAVAVREPRLDVVAVIGQPDQAVAQMDALGRERARQRRQ
jgi:hypothetical protein